MKPYIANVFEEGQVFYAKDVNNIENQLELLTTSFNAMSSISNIWVDENPPEDKDKMWIDLSDNANDISGELSSILNEFVLAMKSLSNEVKELKQLINNGGIIVPPSVNPPEDDIPNIDNNNYILLEDGTILITEDNIPIINEGQTEENTNTESIAVELKSLLNTAISGDTTVLSNDKTVVNLTKEILSELYTMI